eukprot:TRINITY_DN188_c0_g1_i3.p1 TRINITY_DN188_c0_g1~~TRINITY_DN188_c0_g1_i3.p1  ORF type:complete len:261 (-),score=51.75 TRINITY_DN188_c0_g1_i3:80-862(-)
MGGGQSTESQTPEIEESHESECAGCEEEPECKYNSKLVGSVKLYRKHIVICSGLTDWVRKPEKEGGTPAGDLKQIIGAKNLPEGEVLITLCDVPSSGEGVDLFVFPDKVKYTNLRQEDLEPFVDDQIIAGKSCERLKHEVLADDDVYVLVCTHATRDKRCGRAGPQVVGKLLEVVENRGVKDKVKVLSTSHIGGHKYAGVIVVYPHGDWFGYISTRNIEKVIDEYVSKHKILHDLWRGRIGLSKEEQRKLAGFDGVPEKK